MRYWQKNNIKQIIFQLFFSNIKTIIDKNLTKIDFGSKDKAKFIGDVADSVKTSMIDTSRITLEVVTSIDEIKQGTSGITDSMNNVTNSTFKLKDTGDHLKQNVERFKV